MSILSSIKTIFTGQQPQPLSLSSKPISAGTAAPVPTASTKAAAVQPSTQQQIGASIMNTVKVTWNPNDPVEGVTGYNVYQDGVLAGNSTTADFTVQNVTPGAHKYEVAAVNIWGEGPKSDPVSTPNVPSKVVGVQIAINVSVNVGS